MFIFSVGRHCWLGWPISLIIFTMAAASSVSYNDSGTGGNTNSMGFSMNEDQPQVSTGAAVASFLQNQFGRKFVFIFVLLSTVKPLL